MDVTLFKHDRTTFFGSLILILVPLVALILLEKTTSMSTKIYVVLLIMFYKLIRHFELAFTKKIYFDGTDLVFQVWIFKIKLNHQRSYFAVRDKAMIRGSARATTYSLLIIIQSKNPFVRMFCNSINLQSEEKSCLLQCLIEKMEHLSAVYNLKYIPFQPDSFDWNR